jgi:ribosomal protein S18 acetylase RimI-like enzyme
MPHLIKQVLALPPDLDVELLSSAAGEGFGALERLRTDWEAGINRFSDVGEAFYVARFQGRLVGVGGLNRDPYTHEPMIGRIRRLYVLPQFRRRGVGRDLVRHIITDGQRHFRIFHVRTVDPQASAFYVAIGFTLVSGQVAVTHKLIGETD